MDLGEHLEEKYVSFRHCIALYLALHRTVSSQIVGRHLKYLNLDFSLLLGSWSQLTQIVTTIMGLPKKLMSSLVCTVKFTILFG